MTKNGGKAPRLKAPQLLARLAQGAIAAAAVSDVFRLVALRARRLHPTERTLNGSGFASMVFVYLMTLAAVLFLVWLGRCRRNARILSPGAAPVSGFWAVAAWFIPVVNWWVPRAFVLDVRRASAGASEQRPGTGADAGTVLVNTWWAVWMAHMLASVVGQLTGQWTTVPFMVVTEVLNLGAAVLAICVIQHITALQRAALQGAALQRAPLRETAPA